MRGISPWVAHQRCDQEPACRKEQGGGWLRPAWAWTLVAGLAAGCHRCLAGQGDDGRRRVADPARYPCYRRIGAAPAPSRWTARRGIIAGAVRGIMANDARNMSWTAPLGLRHCGTVLAAASCAARLRPDARRLHQMRRADLAAQQHWRHGGRMSRLAGAAITAENYLLTT